MISVLWRGIKEDPWSFLLVMSFFGFALLGAIFAAPAHAAVHIDRPTQETEPVASKDKADCLKPVTIILWHMDANGHLHEIGSVVTVMDMCRQ